jgi:hypothetical protein
VADVPRKRALAVSTCRPPIVSREEPIWLASIWVKQPLAYDGSCGQSNEQMLAYVVGRYLAEVCGRGRGERVAVISGWTVIDHSWKFHISRKARSGNKASSLLPQFTLFD